MVAREGDDHQHRDRRTRSRCCSTPRSTRVNRDNNYAQTAVPGLRAPILQFVNGNMQTLEMELFLDTYEAHRVGSRVLNQARRRRAGAGAQVTDLMDIEPTTHAPPVLLFTWASLSFTCVLARAIAAFMMFLPDGTPVRARLQVTFNEFRNVELEAKEIKRETADYTKRYIVRQGETLARSPRADYGDPRMWRPIALAQRHRRSARD